MAKYLFFIIFFANLCQAASWQAQYSFDYFQTTANYDERGNLEDLNTGSSYDGFFQELKVIYRKNKHLRFHVGMDLNYANSSGSGLDRTNFRLTEVELGTEYRFITNYGRFSSGLEVEASTYSFDNATDEVILAEGTNNAYVYASYYKNFSNRIGIYFEGGYQSRDGGRSSFTRYKSEVQLITMPLILAVGVEGFSSITDDQDTNVPSMKNNVTNRVNGGSFHFYSVNPSRMDLNTWASYSFTQKVATRIGFKKTLNGTSTSDGQNIYFNFFYSWGSSDYSNEEIGINGFKVDDEGEFQIIPDEYEEEELFEEVEAELEKKKKKKKKRKKRKRRRKKKISDDY